MLSNHLYDYKIISSGISVVLSNKKFAVLSYDNAIKACRKVGSLASADTYLSIFNRKKYLDQSMYKYSFISSDYGILKIVDDRIINSNSLDGIAFCLMN
ncbi:hypothetical protein AYY27_04370 [Photobacterium damselae]|nr:hypothetical protein AYY27_04370 [Photobacterium damselae]